MANLARLRDTIAWVGCMSATEAANVVRAQRDYGGSSWAAGEAAAHWCSGGPVAPLIGRAFAMRREIRAMRGGTLGQRG